MTKNQKNKLTKAEEFYIDNNPKKTDEELAEDLGISLPNVREYIHNTQSKSRISKLMVREKGCVIMTEGASMASDEARKAHNEEMKQAAEKRQSEYIHWINK